MQRARLADPLGGMWQAADAQWWWRLPRATDDLALPAWFDEVGPVAMAGLTVWDNYWQADVSAAPSIVAEEESGPRRWRPPPDIRSRLSR